jgi:hypothetical protein
VRFFSATFGAGVIATQCPITRPKRRKHPGTLGEIIFELLGKLIKYIDKKTEKRYNRVGEKNG